MVQQTSDDIRGEMDVLRVGMDGLLSGDWQGTAAAGFAQGWEQWLRGADQVLDALRAMGLLLSETGQRYQDTDGSAAGTVRESGAGL